MHISRPTVIFHPGTAMNTCCASDDCHAPAPDPGYRRILWIALTLNGAMFLIEAGASLIAGSVSLQADALDFLGDAGNYGVSLFVLNLALRWRARAAMGKGIVMGVFGLWVAGNTLFHAVAGEVPRFDLMSGIGLLALTVNMTVALLLFRHRTGDSNRMSVWLCTRNDAIANVAVILAGIAVWLTGTHWPDIAVAAVIAALGLSGAWRVIRSARGELRHASGQFAAQTD
jgi:Co/Zn/Cd efflux system component